MLAVYPPCDPWTRTVNLLDAKSVDSLPLPFSIGENLEAVNETSGDTRGSRVAGMHSVVVHVVERLSAELVIVDWRDPTVGCCAEQTWRTGIARRSGRCALSGAVIHAGDAIYRPRSTRLFQPNARSMILAIELAKAIVDDGMS